MKAAAMKTYRAKVKVKMNGINSTTEIRIQAESMSAAKALIEAQYGKGSLSFGPNEMK